MFNRITRWFAGGSSSDDPIDAFLVMVRKSGLIDELRLERLRQEFYESEKPDGDSLTSLATFLVARNALTPWQTRKLRENKHKGFFLDDYVLFDHMGSTEDSSRYLAREQSSEKLVVITVCQKRGSIESGGRNSL
jgi:hypothetical protein